MLEIIQHLPLTRPTAKSQNRNYITQPLLKAQLTIQMDSFINVIFHGLKYSRNEKFLGAKFNPTTSP
uniref:Uncharacterized protein n=1 Tax=Anguilla anguilla TaxID=7936 RepID=A0A0E9UBS8_ANGAN